MKDKENKWAKENNEKTKDALRWADHWIERAKKIEGAWESVGRQSNKNIE